METQLLDVDLGFFFALQTRFIVCFFSYPFCPSPSSLSLCKILPWCFVLWGVVLLLMVCFFCGSLLMLFFSCPCILLILAFVLLYWFSQTCSLTLHVFQADQNGHLFGVIKLLSLVVARYLHRLAVRVFVFSTFIGSQTVCSSPHLPYPRLFEGSLCAKNHTYTQLLNLRSDQVVGNKDHSKKTPTTYVKDASSKQCVINLSQNL